MPIHALTDYLSVLVGFQVYLRYRRPSNLHGLRLSIYVIGGLLGALIGSRLLALVNDPVLMTNLSFAVIFHNKTIVGAIFGGILGIEIAKKILGISERTGDSIVLPLTIAIIIGRIGCELTGVSDGTIGSACTLPWCFPQGDGIPRHPLPLYEIVVLVAALPLAYRAYIRRLLPEGTLFRLFIIGYFGLRFFLEFLKDNPTTLIGLTAIQIVCLATCIYYIYDVAGQLPRGALQRESTDELRH